MPRTTLNLEPYLVPFTVLIDTAESAPFPFTGLYADADKDARPLIVPTEPFCLGRHPESLGDYSAKELLGRCHTERKSLEDIQSTVLGFTTPYEIKNGTVGRRERFECELENLSNIEAGLVVVEATLTDCLRYMPAYGKKSRELNAKIFMRSILSYQQDYSVQWAFCEDRRMAEVVTFRWFERFWKKEQERLKVAKPKRTRKAKQAASEQAV